MPWPTKAPTTLLTRRAALVALGTTALGACSTTYDQFGSGTPAPLPAAPPPDANSLPPAATAIGTGAVKVGLILPLSAQGNAGLAAQSLKNAAELALFEFNNPNIQLLVKDDGGTTQGATQGAQQAVGEGAEIIVGPLFAQAVAVTGQVARARSVPVIGFSTDTNVAARGVYLLSFLPETDVYRIVDHAAANGRRSIAAVVPDNAYGGVVESALQQAVARRGARVAALERFAPGAIQQAAQRIAPALVSADALFIPDGESAPQVVQALSAAGVNMRRLQLLGSGSWDDQRVFSNASLQGAWYAAPDNAGFRNFSQRYRARYGQEPVRTATLAYDAVALVAALVKTQGEQRFSEPVLTNPSGFAGIDGVFRFRPEGTNERSLAVLRVTPQGGQVVAPAPRTFAA